MAASNLQTLRSNTRLTRQSMQDAYQHTELVKPIQHQPGDRTCAFDGERTILRAGFSRFHEPDQDLLDPCLESKVCQELYPNTLSSRYLEVLLVVEARLQELAVKPRGQEGLADPMFCPKIISSIVQIRLEVTKYNMRNRVLPCSPVTPWQKLSTLTNH